MTSLSRGDSSPRSMLAPYAPDSFRSPASTNQTFDRGGGSWDRLSAGGAWAVGWGCGRGVPPRGHVCRDGAGMTGAFPPARWPRLSIGETSALLIVAAL